MGAAPWSSKTARPPRPDGCLPGVAYSFGLVRVANIATAVDVARHLAKELPQARVACYHANDWRIARFYKEKRLDFLLSRAQGDKHVTADREIRAFLDEAAREGRPDVPFIVVATPVEEVGRDHDFDWAVLDVSSAQSLVQAAGRVNRHRLRPCGDAPNISVPQFNWRHCRNRDRGEPYVPAFCWPGYEGKGKERYSIHDLAQILPWREGRLVITADVRLGEDCRLARRDDKAIAKRLFPYFGPEASEYSFVAERSPAALLSEWVYNETPLRNRMGRTETWRLGRDAERLGDVYEAFVYQGERRGSGGQWVERATSVPSGKSMPCPMHGSGWMPKPCAPNAKLSGWTKNVRSRLNWFHTAIRTDGNMTRDSALSAVRRRDDKETRNG